MEKPELSKVISVKPEIGQNASLFASLQGWGTTGAEMKVPFDKDTFDKNPFDKNPKPPEVPASKPGMGQNKAFSTLSQLPGIVLCLISGFPVHSAQI